MEYFADDFEFCDAIYGATTYYRLKRPLSREKCMVDLKEMSFGKKMDLLARSGKNAGWGSAGYEMCCRNVCYRKQAVQDRAGLP